MSVVIVVFERISALVVLITGVRGFWCAAAAKLRLDSIPFGLHPLEPYFIIVPDLSHAFTTGSLTRDGELELHGEVDGGDLDEENDAEENGHNDESDAVLHVGDEEAV